MPVAQAVATESRPLPISLYWKWGCSLGVGAMGWLRRFLCPRRAGLVYLTLGVLAPCWAGPLLEEGGRPGAVRAGFGGEWAVLGV